VAHGVLLRRGMPNAAMSVNVKLAATSLELIDTNPAAAACL
jgi:hypothetical protein